MSFTREQATKALKATDNNLERAADWIFSHQNELDALESENEPEHSKEIFRDGINRMLYFYNISYLYKFIYLKTNLL